MDPVDICELRERGSSIGTEELCLGIMEAANKLGIGGQGL